MKSLVIALALVPALAFGASKKQTQKQADAENTTLLSGSSISDLGLHGASIFGAYDFTDSLALQNAAVNSLSTDKTFVIGAEYTFPQFTRGMAFQAGGTYDFARTVNSANNQGPSSQLSAFTGFGDLVFSLTPQFSVLGGVNYNFPTLSSSNQNGISSSVKGKIGYEFGASFAATKNIAIDGRYRTLDMDLTQTANGQSGTVDAKLQGLMVDGRYMF